MGAETGGSSGEIAVRISFVRPALSIGRFFSLWLPVALWAALIYTLSGIPHLRVTEAWWDLIARKIAHLCEYAVLARFISRALIGSTFWPWKKIFFVTLGCTFLYAASDEYHQTFTAGRVGCLHDVLIDGAGAWIGMGLWP
jgi:hypothetical protein